MENLEQTLEERKKIALEEARKEGIVDVIGAEKVYNLDALELATKIMREHGPKIYKDLAERRQKQG